MYLICVYFQCNCNLITEQKPKRIFELQFDCKIVDYGTTDKLRQFSIYKDEKRVFWLAAEDIKVILSERVNTRHATGFR